MRFRLFKKSQDWCYHFTLADGRIIMRSDYNNFPSEAEPELSKLVAHEYKEKVIYSKHHLKPEGR